MKNKIVIKDADVTFPLYSTSSNSLKLEFLKKISSKTFFYNNNNIENIKALGNLNLTINLGDRVGILGHNGSGKTTLLRLLSGIYYPTQGHIQIHGIVTPLINISLGINHDLTGIENLHLRAKILNIKQTKLNEYLEFAIKFSGLEKFLELPVRTYSSGMQLRLAFASSVFAKPEILVMDEWLSVGDEDFKKRSNKKLDELITSSNIFIIASHSLELIRRICNRVIVLNKGSIIMDGEVEEAIKVYKKIS